MTVSALKWHKHRYAHGRYVCGDYYVYKDHSRLGDVWKLYFKTDEIAQSTTMRGVQDFAFEHYKKNLPA
jgi:hypothetical protein